MDIKFLFIVKCMDVRWIEYYTDIKIHAQTMSINQVELMVTSLPEILPLEPWKLEAQAKAEASLSWSASMA